MASRREEQALVPVEQARGVEVAEGRGVSSAVGAALTAAAMSQIRLAMEYAQQFPRNEDHCRGRVLKVCKNPAFADKATWRYPRGGKQLEGASIVLANEMAKLWQHFQSGFYVVEDLGRRRTVRGWAWDVQEGVRKEADCTFEKLIYRKFRQGEKEVGRWIEPDERDLLELTNRMGSKAVRNCIIATMPWDLVQEAMDVCRATRATEDAKDPDATRKKMIERFASLGVNAAELTAYLGYPLEQLTPQDVEHLRGVYTAIREGETNWHEVVGKRAEQEGVSEHKPKTAASLRKAVQEKAEAARRGGQEKREGGGG